MTGKKPVFNYTTVHRILQRLSAEWEFNSTSTDICNLRGPEWAKGVLFGLRLAERELSMYHDELEATNGGE